MKLEVSVHKEHDIVGHIPNFLSDEEINKMVKDAEANKEADKKKRESVDVRNQADSLVFSTEKSLKEHGDKVSAEEKKAIENGIADLKKSLEGTDAEDIKKKTQSLIQVSMKLGEAVYKSQQKPEADKTESPKDAKPNDLHNSNAPVAGTNGVDKSHAESEEPEDIETEFLEEDLQDDWTESSASVSEKSANAPIRNKKVPFGVIRKILKKLTTPKNRVGDHDDSVFQKRDRIDRSNDNSQASEKSTGSGTTSQKNSKQMVKRSGKVEPTISAEEKQTNER